MAARPWVTPQEVKAYSDYPEIQNRSDAKLETDITRAEEYVIAYTNNTFADGTAYPSIPPAVKTAVILLAEAYGYNSHAATATMKSETFDDYSYTAEVKTIDIERLDVKALLDGYIVVAARSGITMRMRKL
jgi:hypothetical protein